MAFIDKDGYERKREWAARRMAANKEVETLTEEQHDLLEELASFRHELHVNHDSAFNPNSGDFNKFAKQISIWYVGLSEHDLHSDIKRAFGIAPFTPVDYPTLEDYEDYGLTYEEAQEDAFAAFEKINTEIEDFLMAIDKEHGTDYAPSGVTRR